MRSKKNAFECILKHNQIAIKMATKAVQAVLITKSWLIMSSFVVD